METMIAQRNQPRAIDTDGGEWSSRLLLGRNRGGAQVPAWLESAWETFRETVQDRRYPCFFGGHAYRANAIYHSFVSNADAGHLPETLRFFLENCRHHPLANLAVFFEPSDESHAQCSARFWAQLQAIQDADTAFEYTEGDIGTEDPDTPMWEFTYCGVQMFVVGFSPTYRRRRSRNIGRCMVMLFQPRSVFGGEGADAEIDDRTRAVIRERILAWDGMAHHPALGSYGDEGNREWKQYFLPDNDDGPIGGCPLKSRLNRGAE